MCFVSTFFENEVVWNKVSWTVWVIYMTICIHYITAGLLIMTLNFKFKSGYYMHCHKLTQSNKPFFDSMQKDYKMLVLLLFNASHIESSVKKSPYFRCTISSNLNDSLWNIVTYMYAKFGDVKICLLWWPVDECSLILDDQ